MYKNIVKSKNNIAQIAGMKVTDIAKKFKTPVICYDQSMLEENMKMFKENFFSTKFSCEVIYASKAFSVKAIYQLLKKYDLGADIVSGGELYTALAAGMDAQHLYFHGNNKSEEELQLAIKSNIGCIVIDNIYEIDLLNKILTKQKQKVKVMIRLNPGIDAHTHTYIHTAKLTSKFGISIYQKEEVLAFIEKIVNSQYLEFMGVHFHIGSQIFDPRAHIKAAKVVIEFMKELFEENNISMKWLNIGGGFGISINDQDEPYDIKVILKDTIKNIEKFLNKNNLTIEKLTIEPGRSLVSEAGATLYTIGGIKDTKMQKKYVFVDGGMGDNIRPALYQAKYECDVANKMEEIKKEKFSIAGKNCESGDILINNILLQEAEIGDLLLIYSTGAYCYSMSSNYNRNVRPEVIFIKDGQAKTVVRRETYENLIINDIDLEE